MMATEDPLKEFEREFHKELEGITDIEQLKEIYAREIARRDKIITNLQKQNDIILKTAFKQRSDETKFE
ncbi:MAG: hypothetical protein ACOCU6_02315 [Nanoarchaeota archaeon]